MPTAEYALLMQGNFTEAMKVGLYNMMPLGLFWLFTGLLVFAVVHNQTKSYGISGMVFATYSALILGYSLVDVSIQPFMALLVALVLAIMLIKVIMK